MSSRRLVVVLCLLLSRASFAQTVNDPNLKVQKWTSGLTRPTGITFLPDGRALILEKETGKVKIMNGRSITGTALDLPVATDSERGLLGMALSPSFAGDHQVYLYFTAAAQDGGDPIAECVKRYTFDGSTLTFNKKIIDLPATPGPNHNSGKIAFGPDKKLYIVIGDLNRNEITSNHNNGAINRIGAVLRVNPSGSSVTSNPFFNAKNTGKKKARNDIFAYGIRNSFGIDFDPVSGVLWETENGPSSFDEINRITAGFNGGWESILGPTSRNGMDPSTLVSLGKNAHYSDPKFSWAVPVAPTDALFMPTARLGSQYRNDLFVSTFKEGKILHFDLTSTRKSLSLGGSLADQVADNSTGDRSAEQGAITFASGFDSLTDVTAGPGGIYALGYNGGVVYRITTVSSATQSLMGSVVPEPGALSVLLFSGGACVFRRGKTQTRRERRR
jgi:aldose sugar dehydrogenase